jgi:hypothetical protein
MANGMYRQMRNIHRVVLEKPEEKSQLETAKHRWEDNTKMALKQDGSALH